MFNIVIETLTTSAVDVVLRIRNTPRRVPEILSVPRTRPRNQEETQAEKVWSGFCCRLLCEAHVDPHHLSELSSLLAD